MNILFFSRLFYPHIGGVETHVFEVGKRLVQKGHTVTVVTEQFQQYLKNSQLHKNIQIARVAVGKDDWFKKFRIWWWLWNHQKLMSKVDIIHCHDVFFWYLPFRFLYPKKPVYTTFHGYETKYPLSQKAILTRKISEKLSWGNICVGDYIEKRYRTNPTYVTYGGVTILPMPQIHTNTTNKKIKIVFVGRLEEDTGIQTYLEALKILKKRVEFTFEACGDGTFRKEVTRWGKVHGVVRDITPYLIKANFVFASSYLSILQAMAAKKLVFATYENQLKRDYLVMSPFVKYIVISHNQKEISEKLIYFRMHRDELEKLVNKGYTWVKNQSWDKVVNVYEKLWRIE